MFIISRPVRFYRTCIRNLTRFQLSEGEEQSGNFIELSARIFQHESEHMDGEIFIDNVSGYRLQAAMRKRKKILRQLKKEKKG